MKKLIIVLCCVIAAVTGKAQKTDGSKVVVQSSLLDRPAAPSASFSRTVYFDANRKITKQKKLAAFYRPPVTKDGDHYDVEFFTIDNKHVMYGTYYPAIVNYQLNLDDSLAIKDGFFIYYDAAGEKESEGNYTNNLKTGEWKYYKEGKQTSSTMYNGGNAQAQIFKKK